LLREAGVVGALLLLYRLGRMLGRHESARAFDNARDVLGLEDRLGLDTELSLQRATLGHPGLIRLLNRYYASVHFGASMALQRERNRRALATPGDSCDMDVTCRPAGSAPAQVRAGRSW
jgi:hypothetical protein